MEREERVEEGEISGRTWELEDGKTAGDLRSLLLRVVLKALCYILLITSILRSVVRFDMSSFLNFRIDSFVCTTM